MTKMACTNHKQNGMMLLEALIAILIFAVGILGIVGLQAVSIKQGTDARFRSEASLLANQLIGQMWLTNRTSATLNSNFTPGNAKYTTWQAQVAATLPLDAGHNPNPSVTVNTTANDPGEGTVTIQMWWLAPNEPVGTDPHTYVSVAQIK